MLGAGAVLRAATAEARIAVAAGGDRAGDDALAFVISLDGGAELFDDAHRLMADGQAFGDGIFALEDVDVSAADRGRGDAHQGIARSDIGNWFLVEHDSTRLDEDGGFHAWHLDLLLFARVKPSGEYRRRIDARQGL